MYSVKVTNATTSVGMLFYSEANCKALMGHTAGPGDACYSPGNSQSFLSFMISMVSFFFMAWINNAVTT
jgi:hypothetical protein